MDGKYKASGAVGIILAIWALILIGPGGSFGGNLEPTSAPGAEGTYTLQDVYDRLETGAAGSLSTATAPSAAPADSRPTVNEIMGIAPALDDTNGATESDVAQGKTFWGLSAGQWGPRTGTGRACTEALTPKTGQTKCFNARGTEIACAGTGQDGDLQKGLEWPTPRFTDNNNGTVTDNLTGLVWLKNANCAGTTKDWTDALAFSNALKNGDCGLSDGSVAGGWHLPNTRELHSLIDFGSYSPALPSGYPFQGVESVGYWSSTSRASNTDTALYVNLGNGNVHNDYKTKAYHVWPVREGQ